ncbi:MAG: V-type ATP synthase subunit F [Verrucomicrobia bacterium]|jgi:V/A-type H+-transporting ATPase subunit F|nr:V-type ATP synthase subunit F [Verrucomicrobiota bacterium]
MYCIADEDTVRGFRLAGVAGERVRCREEAAEALARAAARSDCALIILTEAVAAGIRSQVDELRSDQSRPLVVEIPGPEGPWPGHRSLRRLVQEAVGVRVGP